MISDTFPANPTGRHIRSRPGHQEQSISPREPGERQKRVPSAKKCFKNAYPQPESRIPRPRRASKSRTLSQKVHQKTRTLKQKADVEMKDALVGWGWMMVKNAYPSSESASKMRTLRQKVGFEASKTRTLHQKVRQNRVPSCRKRSHRHSAPEPAPVVLGSNP